MKYGSILIVTYGRSGSTLLQGVLNTIDGVRVTGENYEFCYHIYRSWKSLTNAKQIKGSKKTDNLQNPWYGASELNPERFLSGMVPLVREQLVGVRSDTNQPIVYGFKEIRYIHHLDELGDYLDFLNQMMPNPAIIFNVRTHADVMRSGWWKHTNPIKTKAILEKADQAFLAYSDNHSNAFLIRYEDVIKGYDGLQPLLHFLGTEIDANDLAKTLGTIHSYDVSEKIQSRHKPSESSSDTFLLRLKAWVLRTSLWSINK